MASSLPWIETNFKTQSRKQINLKLHKHFFKIKVREYDFCYITKPKISSIKNKNALL